MLISFVIQEALKLCKQIKMGILVTFKKTLKSAATVYFKHIKNSVKELIEVEHNIYLKPLFFNIALQNYKMKMFTALQKLTKP